MLQDLPSAATHQLFDLLAAALAAGVLKLTARRFPPPPPAPREYLLWLIVPAAVLAFAFGTLNLFLSGQPGIARSVFGAFVGGILGVEAWKRRDGVVGSTGGRLVLPLCAGLSVGRVGCHLAGLADFTHGTESRVPWAVDLGDGVPRHPVALYEAGLLLAFGVLFVLWLRRDPGGAASRGFYVFTGFYAVTRFALEALKPYGRVLGLTIFQLAAVVLLVYAISHYRRASDARTRAEALRLPGTDDVSV